MPEAAPGSVNRLIGDGSTAYTGRQPNVQQPQKLKPGEKPPQFVVFSWDGMRRGQPEALLPLP